VCYVGYLRWTHPLRGEVRPAEFLRVAETTGLAATLSRAVLDALREDYASLQLRGKPDLRISFGALRHHILREDFVADLRAFLAKNGVPEQQLELRISERSFISADPAAINALSDLGIRLVVDEVGRGLASLDRPGTRADLGPAARSRLGEHTARRPCGAQSVPGRDWRCQGTEPNPDSHRSR